MFLLSFGPEVITNMPFEAILRSIISNLALKMPVTGSAPSEEVVRLDLVAKFRMALIRPPPPPSLPRISKIWLLIRQRVIIKLGECPLP